MSNRLQTRGERPSSQEGKLTRRETLRRGLTASAVLAMGVPDWAIPALAQGETDVPFTDIPENFPPSNPNSTTRIYDIRGIDGMFTPKDKFFAIQHYNRPVIDPASYRLKISGLVNRPTEFSLDDLRSLPSTEVAAGYECSGNSARVMQGLSSCGLFTGVSLGALLGELGVQPEAQDVVFFGTDKGDEEVVFRANTFMVNQQFARSMSIQNAMRPEPLLAYALNGEPLTLEQGFPVRLIMPGWYGVANVKWLSEVHLQEDRFVGKFQATWYRTMMGEGMGEVPDDQVQWVETEVTRLQIKSVIARVTKQGNAHNVMGFVLNDGTPLRAVEIQVDGGPWQRAALDPANTQYSWKRFRFRWEGARAGEHTLVSRAIDINGKVQPVEAELANKRTFLEHNAQFPRKVMIA